MILVFAETWSGQFKKSTFEAVQYAAACASAQGSQAVAVVVGPASAPVESLGAYGAHKVIHLHGPETFETAQYATMIGDLAKELGASLLIVNGTANGRALMGALAVRAEAGVISNVTALPESYSPVRVVRGAFSSKGIEVCESTAARTVIGLVPNALGAKDSAGSNAAFEDRSVSASARASVVEQQLASGSIALPEAERVVSAGRGMKAPENWGMIEELAQVLGAATACSKPVSDIGWRPHREHVGQTGIQVNPQLYIAVGISGAIQHLAGVSSSKTIVVINSDPEAPFFKAADYGIVGDAFDIVPRLTAALRKHLN
ncbi:MAG: electron transfer flavoprotein subunit alpha/FixB family protein [Schleiferiaceae bacterium]|jgi:electron transfer flavoprotein alpha subunit